MADAVREPTGPLTLLAETREQVDRVLATIPDNRLEARRVITREWGFDPTPEQLQVIVKLAHDPVAADGLQRELTCTALAARIFVELLLRDLIDAKELDAGRIREIGGSLADCAHALQALEQQFQTIGEGLGAFEGEFLEQAGDALIPSGDTVVAADVMAPRLERIARADSEEDVRSAAPLLTTAEVQILVSIVCPEPADPARVTHREADRACLNAAVLSAVMLDDVSAMEELSESDADGSGTDQEAVVERLRRDRVAYRLVLDRLRKQVDAATMAGLGDYASTLRRSQRGLTRTHMRLVGTLNAARPGSVPAEEIFAESIDLRRLLQESAEEDSRADEARDQCVTKEELYLDALKGDQTPDVVHLAAYDLKSERKRIRVLTAIAAVLLAGCVGVWSWHLKGAENPLEVPLAEMSDTLILDQAVSVGPMMYAVVSHWSWDDMSVEERLSSVRALGLSAANHGYDTVYLVDEARNDLAMWTKSGGAELKGKDAANAETTAEETIPAPAATSAPSPDRTG